MTLDKLQLQNISKKGYETFKESLLYDKKMVCMFIYTLQPPFYEHMLGSVSPNFADIVIIGKTKEFVSKSGKIKHGLLVAANAKKSGFNFERKEGEV